MNDYHQAKRLVEIAAIAAQHGEALLRSKSVISRTGIESYWLASRNRQEIWNTTLKQLEMRAAVISKRLEDSKNSVAIRQFWEDYQPLAEEILASETLTRVWTAIGSESDRNHQTAEVTPFVQSVFTKHLECRNRLLRLAVQKITLPDTNIKQLDTMRRRAERWSDVLLGYLVRSIDLQAYAFDISRVRDFSVSLSNENQSADITQSLLMISLRSTFQAAYTGNCPNAALNGRICEAVLSCFGSDIFDSVGAMESVWQLRLANATKDTTGMIECLAAEHQLHTSITPADNHG